MENKKISVESPKGGMSDLAKQTISKPCHDKSQQSYA